MFLYAIKLPLGVCSHLGSLLHVVQSVLLKFIPGRVINSVELGIAGNHDLDDANKCPNDC